MSSRQVPGHETRAPGAARLPRCVWLAWVHSRAVMLRCVLLAWVHSRCDAALRAVGAGSRALRCFPRCAPQKPSMWSYSSERTFRAARLLAVVRCESTRAKRARTGGICDAVGGGRRRGLLPKDPSASEVPMVKSYDMLRSGYLYGGMYKNDSAYLRYL